MTSTTQATQTPLQLLGEYVNNSRNLATFRQISKAARAIVANRAAFRVHQMQTIKALIKDRSGNAKPFLSRPQKYMIKYGSHVWAVSIWSSGYTISIDIERITSNGEEVSVFSGECRGGVLEYSGERLWGLAAEAVFERTREV